MFQTPILQSLIPVIIIQIVISGCDDRATRIALDAADRQAQQNTAMAELNKEVATGTRQLVEADAQSRQEIVGVHRDLQAERSRLDTAWNTLEQERRQIARELRTESMLIPVTQLIGGLALVIVLVGLCWYALVAAHRGDDTDAELNELLVQEILPDQTPLLSSSLPSLLVQSRPDERPAE